MAKTYKLQEFKNDPRTKGRSTFAVIHCIENNKTSIEEIFAEIDKAYATGKHRRPSLIKFRKKQALYLLERIIK